MARTKKRFIGMAVGIGLMAIVAMGGGGASERSGATDVKEITYKTVGERELRLYINYPADWKPSDTRPAIIFYFGGGPGGGHLAACMMIEKSCEAAGDDLSISTIPQAMVLFNPVLNFENEEMMKRFGVDKDIAGKISPTKYLTKKAPPAPILFGTDDRLKVHGDEYWGKAEGLGVRAEKYLAEGQGPGFFNRSPWREQTLIAA